MISIGIDQSYTRTGIAIFRNKKLIMVKSLPFKKLKSKTEKRKYLQKSMYKLLEKLYNKYDEDICITIERIRTFSHNQSQTQTSQQFISTDYIKATGALVATIVDTCYDFGLTVYSVDTRSWKSQIVGKGKAKGKTATLEYVKNKLAIDVNNDDEADAVCIALYRYIPQNLQKLKEEK